MFLGFWRPRCPAAALGLALPPCLQAFPSPCRPVQITGVAQGWLKRLLTLGTLQLPGIFQTFVLGEQERPGGGSVVSHSIPRRDPLVPSSAMVAGLPVPAGDGPCGFGRPGGLKVSGFRGSTAHVQLLLCWR